ncbi:hypothetical protein [Tomitella cavernea]|uniref:Minor tail protein n=1 Tax=Tomitella cavernea TaxID=1387982 RepID=A0ABP9CET6_9ACTN|nr:hypothetical protein [Tomitella cavernea]
MSRVVQLIRRNADGIDELVLDVAGPEMGAQGVLLGKGSLKAMYHAPRTTPQQVLASLPGAIPSRDRVETRVFTLIVRTEAHGGDSWEDVDSLLWSVARPGVYWIIRVESDDGGEVREITVRRTGTPKLTAPDGTDPARAGYAVWEIEVTAFDPWWYGPPVVDEFVNPSSGTHSETLVLPNTGDHDAWLRWIIRESEAAQTWTIPDGLGVYPEGHAKAGQRIMHTLPELAAGKHGMVDTSPQRIPLSVLDEPMAFGKLRQTRWTHAIPPGLARVELPVTVTGSATAGIRVKLTPRYERPYGRTL